MLRHETAYTEGESHGKTERQQGWHYTEGESHDKTEKGNKAGTIQKEKAMTRQRKATRPALYRRRKP